MSKYTVIVYKSIYAHIEVEADSEDAAKEAAVTSALEQEHDWDTASCEAIEIVE